eukprot:TRINITY_DN12550_c0_g1_i1.p1 TRINITY_DN12550_c0_g1~~TRINITY_DN12550_c0_g1_i1.p1  ORF type:complete len:280 (-),score=53.21 TRINITY_DN12550_c0_g1_i1:50-889(-)
MKSLLCVLLLIGVCIAMPCPFTRTLRLKQPPMEGSDVSVLQNLLIRSPYVGHLTATGQYDASTAEAVKRFNAGNRISESEIFDEHSANELLSKHLLDGYKDNGKIPAGFKYKVHVPVYRNRSIETKGTLYDDKMRVMHTFIARTHGQDNADGSDENMMCDSGNTPTGLMTFDLNSPEPDPVSYGPYPVNRAVQGLDGNARFLISNIRDGILLHTGEWPNWNTMMPMPNSHGCIHAHPQDIHTIWQILVNQLNVTVHQNTYGKLPYPYTPQGILSVDTIN